MIPTRIRYYLEDVDEYQDGWQIDGIDDAGNVTDSCWNAWDGELIRSPEQALQVAIAFAKENGWSHLPIVEGIA